MPTSPTLRLDLRSLFRKWGRVEGKGWASAIQGASAVGERKAGPRNKAKKKPRRAFWDKPSTLKGKKGKRKSGYKKKGEKLAGRGGSLSVEAAKSKYVKRKTWGYVYQASKIGGRKGTAGGRDPGQKLTWFRRGTVHSRAHPFKSPPIDTQSIAREVGAEIARQFRQLDKRTAA